MLDCFFFSPSSVDVIVRLKLSRDALHKIKKTIWIWLISKRLRVKYYMLKLINENITNMIQVPLNLFNVKNKDTRMASLGTVRLFLLSTLNKLTPTSSLLNLAFLFITLNRCLHACWLAQKTKMNFNSCFKLFYLPEFSFRDTNNSQGNGEDDP